MGVEELNIHIQKEKKKMTLEANYVYNDGFVQTHRMHNTESEPKCVDFG